MQRRATLFDTRPRKAVGLVILTALLFAGSPGLVQAIPYTATASGNFSNPAIWSPVGVPGNADDATIPAGMTVDFAGNIQVATVTVQAGGSLIGTSWNNMLETNTLTVDPGGVARGFDNINGGSGGTLSVGPLTIGNLTVQNDGLMRGGHPAGGLFFFDGNGDASCSPTSSILSNGGVFRGGNDTGGVFMVSGTIDLFNAIVEGGSGAAPFNLFGQSVAGGVYISGHTIILDGTFPGLTRVVSGSNSTLGGTAGSLAIMARACGFPSSLFIGPTAFVDVGTPSIGGCPDVRLFSAGTSTILGTVGTVGTSCAYWDPPDLVLAGDGRVTADDLTIVGDNFDASGLGGGGLEAGQNLKIFLGPGGVLNLQGLAPGNPHFRAGQGITLCADEIALDAGVSLSELMDPAPVLCPGRRLAVLSVPPAVNQTVAPGDSITLLLEVMNVGNSEGLAKVHLGDSAGWLAGGPQSQVQTLQPGETITLSVTLVVPESPDVEYTALELTGEISGGPAQVETSVFTMK